MTNWTTDPRLMIFSYISLVRGTNAHATVIFRWYDNVGLHETDDSEGLAAT